LVPATVFAVRLLTNPVLVLRESRVQLTLEAMLLSMAIT
jgi:hypothetical protein